MKNTSAVRQRRTEAYINHVLGVSHRGDPRRVLEDPNFPLDVRYPRHGFWSDRDLATMSAPAPAAAVRA